MMIMKTLVVGMMKGVGVEWIMIITMIMERRAVGLGMIMNMRQSIITFHIATNTRNSSKLVSK